MTAENYHINEQQVELASKFDYSQFWFDNNYQPLCEVVSITDNH